MVTLHEFRSLVLAITLAICGSLGMDIHLASLPHIMVYMHTDKQHIQQSVSLFILGVALSILIYGPISDRLGRKPVIIFGLTLACVASYFAAFTHHIGPFLMMRFLQGAGSGVCWGLGRIIAADVMQNERLAAIGSYFTLFLSLSPLLAPAIGGYMQTWFGWQSNFILLGTIILLVLTIFIIFFKETNLYLQTDKFTLRSLFKTYLSFFGYRLFVGCMLLTGIGMSANIIYTTISSFIFQQEFHTSPVIFGWLTATVGVANIIGKLICPFFILRLKNVKSLLIGVVLLFISGAYLTLFSWLNAMSILVVLTGVAVAIFAFTFIGSITMSMALSPFRDKRGTAGALYGSFQLLISFAASAIAASFTHAGTSVLAVSYLSLGILAFVFYFGLIKPGKTVTV